MWNWIAGLFPTDSLNAFGGPHFIAALILLQPELDKNYQAVKAATVPL